MATLIKEVNDIGRLIMGTSLFQCERYRKIEIKGKYFEWEQTLANVLVITGGFFAADTVLKFIGATRFCVPLGYVMFSAAIVPSTIFHMMNCFDVEKKRFMYQIINNLHRHMDQVGSLVVLVSNVVFLYLGAPLWGWTGISFASSALGLLYARLSVNRAKLLENAEQLAELYQKNNWKDDWQSSDILYYHLITLFHKFKISSFGLSFSRDPKCHKLLRDIKEAEHCSLKRDSLNGCVKVILLKEQPDVSPEEIFQQQKYVLESFVS